MRQLTVFVLLLLLSTSLAWGESDDVKTLTQQAKSGDAKAQYDLALHYLFAKEISQTGIETPPDYPQAALWMERAAKQGNAQAQYLLGTLYERGRGVGQNSNRAMEWYKKALGNGNMDAACPLARLYEASDIHPKDPEVTRPCYMK